MPLDLAMTPIRTAVGDVMNARSSVGTQRTLYDETYRWSIIPITVCGRC